MEHSENEELDPLNVTVDSSAQLYRTNNSGAEN